MRSLFLLLVALLFAGCSCSSNHRTITVGVDATWYPLAFGDLQPYVNGYTEDVLLEVSRYSGLNFEKIPANWDTLLGGLREGKYVAVLTSLPPYMYNKAKYDFSENFLELGPVLVVPVNANHNKLADLEGQLVGVIANDPAGQLIQREAGVIQRNYASIPDLLNGVASGEVAGALLDSLAAASYVRDLYSGILKVASTPLTEAGLHVITLRDKDEPFLRLFNKSLKALRSKDKLEGIQQKWNLLVP